MNEPSTKKSPPLKTNEVVALATILAHFAPLLAVVYYLDVARHVGWVLTLLACLTLVGLVIGPRRSRAWLRRTLHAALLRWQLTRAFFHAPGTLREHHPFVRKVTATLAGDDVTLRLPHGETLESVQLACARIAVSLRVREVRVTRVDASAHLVQMFIVRRNPFATVRTSALATRARTTENYAVTVGVDDSGRDVRVSLHRHVLLGGEPGAGKSNALQVLLAHCALDPSLVLWLFDGKLVELSLLEECAYRFVGPDLDDAIDALEELGALMDERYRVLKARGQREVSIFSDLARHVVVIDELALFVAGPDKARSQRVAKLLGDLVARGRAAGITVIAATQRPSVDIVPAFLRDLFSVRWAFRCTTRDASDTVLGAGWASRGYSADVLKMDSPGESFLLSEGNLPVRLRADYLSDDQIRAIATRATAARLDWKTRSTRAPRSSGEHDTRPPHG